MEKYSVLSRADPVVWRRRATGVTGIGESMADNRTSSKNRLTRSFLLAFEDTQFLQKDELRHAAQAEYARGYYRTHRCYAPWLHTLVGWDGDVWPCCMSRGQLPPLGNVRHTPLQEIFTGDVYTALRQQFLTARPPLCHRCDNFLSENRLLEPYL